MAVLHGKWFRPEIVQSSIMSILKGAWRQVMMLVEQVAIMNKIEYDDLPVVTQINK
jgi:hypothetical protein